MTTLRSLLFVVWLYLSMAVFAIGLSPTLLLPYRVAMTVIRFWARFVLFGLRWIAGVKVEFRGLEHRPTGAALMAGKHQSMLDVIAPFAILPDNCFIMKKELMPLPFFGWFAWKTRMIAVDRSAHAKALKDMVKQARARHAEGRQILIFPEGTRAEVGAAPDYKPGIAALYRDLDVPCTPIATNSGQHWPAHGFRRHPGTVVYEFLPPVPAGLKRAEFMAQLEETLERASNALSKRVVKERLKFGELKSVGHNISDSLASGIGLLIGYYEMDVFGEAKRSPEGFIEVNFLTGETSGAQPSAALKNAIAAYAKDGLDELCLRHGTTRKVFTTLTTKFGVDAVYGDHFTVTVADNHGRTSTNTFVGHPGRNLRNPG